MTWDRARCLAARPALAALRHAQITEGNWALWHFWAVRLDPVTVDAVCRQESPGTPAPFEFVHLRLVEISERKRRQEAA